MEVEASRSDDAEELEADTCWGLRWFDFRRFRFFLDFREDRLRLEDVRFAPFFDFFLLDLERLRGFKVVLFLVFTLISPPTSLMLCVDAHRATASARAQRGVGKQWASQALHDPQSFGRRRSSAVSFATRFRLMTKTKKRVSNMQYSSNPTKLWHDIVEPPLPVAAIVFVWLQNDRLRCHQHCLDNDNCTSTSTRCDSTATHAAPRDRTENTISFNM